MDQYSGVITSGGQNVVDVLVRKWNGTAYDYYKLNAAKDDLEVVASPARATAKIFTYQALDSVNIQPQEDGTYKVDMSNYDLSQEQIEMLDVLAVPAAGASAALPDITFINGAKKLGAATSADGYEVVLVIYGTKNTAKTPSEILTHVIPGTISPTSGSFEMKGEDYNKPSFSFNGKLAEHDEAIPVALFYTHASDDDLGILDTEAVATWAPTLKSGKGCIRKYVAVPNA